MIDQALLDILRCPATHQSLSMAAPQLVAACQASHPNAVAFESGLVTADGLRFYPIRSGIPVMLVTEALTLTPQS